MKKQNPYYRTLEQLRTEIIERVSIQPHRRRRGVYYKNCSPVTITRIHEILFGTMIATAPGDDDPAGEYKVKT